MNVVFLDRDGTVIYDPPDERVDKIEKIKLFPDSITALKFLADNDIGIVFITNQAGIAESRITEDDFWRIHNEVLMQLAPSGVKVFKTYLNGEAEGAVSEYRKPKPGMLLQAAKELNLDLSKIYMVGDHQSDVVAGINAGCKGSILVKTANVNVESKEAVFTARNLLEATKFIVENSQASS